MMILEDVNPAVVAEYIAENTVKYTNSEEQFTYTKTYDTNGLEVSYSDQNQYSYVIERDENGNELSLLDSNGEGYRIVTENGIETFYNFKTTTIGNKNEVDHPRH